ncbi:MAG: ATP-grasp domain-containing protein [Bacteroidales bacterium]|nr:ATP-grasp domain-containing protein [Bacteroidales bacterium]
MSKKLMLLGGIRYLLPVIQAAHQQGYYVITADYLPDNIAHRYSDEYVNVSIVDKKAVLAVAKERHIDGIMSFGVDPGVVSAAYVQTELGLPSFGPFQSVEILQNKDKFRTFLRDNHFNVPYFKSYGSLQDAGRDKSEFNYPVIVKPTDSAGSKGVSRVDREDQLLPAIESAFNYSFSGHIIIEEFIEKKGCSSDTDCFSIDGKLSFVSFSAQRFDPEAPNPNTPSAYSWPSTFTDAEERYLTSEIQRLISLLGMKTLVYNVETRVGINGIPYIMELTPRGGGNRLSEMLRYATGVDMITAITRTAVGDPIGPIEQKDYNGHWAEIILHSNKQGRFQSIQIDHTIPAEIIEKDLWVKPGDYIHAFNGANDAIGTLILRFDDAEKMEYYISHYLEWLIMKVL